MFLRAIKEKELLFPRHVSHINLFCFLSIIYYNLFFTNECKTMLVGNFKVIKILQRNDSYNQPMPSASCFQTSPFLLGLLTSFCKAGNWLVLIAAADCHPLRLKLKVLPWCGGRAFPGRWETAEEGVSNGICQKPSENKVTLTLNEYHKKTCWRLCSSDQDFKLRRKWNTSTQNFFILQIEAWKIKPKIFVFFSPSINFKCNQKAVVKFLYTAEPKQGCFPFMEDLCYIYQIPQISQKLQSFFFCSVPITTTLISYC